MKATSNKITAFAALLKKEFRQFFASSFLPRLCIAFPLMIMLIMPLVANMEVRNVGVAIVDLDHSALSRSIASNISASDYTRLVAMPSTYAQALKMVEQGHVDVIVEIPYRFQSSLTSRQPQQLCLSANAVNASKGSLGMQYVQQIISQTMLDHIGRPLAPGNVKIATLNLFNPTFNYRHFMIPALMIMLVVMLCGFLPALNIVGEKERGTIEQINVSPISQFTFTLGKIVPYWIIGLVVITLAMVVAWAVYGLVPKGNVGLIYLASFVFIIVMSSMAALLANFSDNMQQVMLVMFFFVMVFILMSGLLTPIATMPHWAQMLTYAIPPRYYVDIMRSIYLRGANIVDLWQQFAALLSIAIIFVTIAIATYRKQS